MGLHGVLYSFLMNQMPSALCIRLFIPDRRSTSHDTRSSDKMAVLTQKARDPGKNGAYSNVGELLFAPRYLNGTFIKPL